jgi:sugar-specific transcriptional regulator TrmB
MEPKDLVELGLSPNESKVYLALIELGSATADKISAQAGIHRRTVYDNISKLLEKGLISYAIRSNKKFFEAANPEKLGEILQEKREIIEGEEKILKGLLPELKDLQKSSKNIQEVNVYKGKEGVKTVLWDILRTAKSNCVIGAHSSKQFKLMLHKFHKERVKRGIKNTMIFKREDNKRAKRFSKLPFTTVRLMPDEYVSPIAINIYENKVALLLRSEKDPFGVLIESKGIADGFRAYFNILWAACKRL